MIKKIFGVIRLPFLLLVPACLAPAFAVAYRISGAPAVAESLLILIAALTAHIGVNALNEYEDFRSGLDFVTKRTPFSGGSGTLVADTDFAPVALYVALVAILVTFTVGLYFCLTLGSAVVVPGLLGLAIIIGYTRWINRYPLLCLLAPGLGFGLIMVNLTVLVLVGGISVTAVWISIPITLLVSNLLLINQLPDTEADRRVGRNHIAIAWGERHAAKVVGLLLAGCYLSIIAGWYVGSLPVTALLSCLTVPLAIFVVAKAVRFDPAQHQKLIPAMAANVAVTLATPVLLAVGLVAG